VRDSRPAVREEGIRRKRQCVCGVVFFTLEVFERKAS
jgi:transcriptional regulator NrdR family protein